MSARREQDREDRDRLIRIEMGLEALEKNINEHVIGRLDNHGNRIRRIERIALVGSGVLVSAKVVFNYLIGRKV